MKQALKIRNPAPWMGALLVLAAAIALVACDGDVDITAPPIPVIPPAGTVWVAGTLTSTSEGGSCLEARILYDGQVIGRNSCEKSSAGDSCSEIKLQGFKEASAGRHTIELQVLRQSPAEVVYRAEVELRSGPFRPPFQTLGPISQALREGESVTFDTPWLCNGADLLCD